MNCSECRPILHAYLDGELDVRTALEMESHLSGCSECSSRHGAVRQISQAVRVHASRFTLSPAFEERLRSSLRESSRAEAAPIATRPRRVWLAFPLAAALLLAWLGGAWWGRPSLEQRLGEDVIAAHVRSLIGDHLTDVASSDRHTVNPWFQGKLPFAVGARDFASRGFTLVGGRLDYVGGREVAALVYQHGAHAINVFVWQAEAGVEPPAGKFVARGYSSRCCVKDGLTHWAVSDVDDSALQELVDLLRTKP